jgi:hypothetical protein
MAHAIGAELVRRLGMLPQIRLAHVKEARRRYVTGLELKSRCRLVEHGPSVSSPASDLSDWRWALKCREACHAAQ